MDVTAGDKLHITATGTVDFSDKKGVDSRWRSARMERHSARPHRSQRRPWSARRPGRQRPRRNAVCRRSRRHRHDRGQRTPVPRRQSGLVLQRRPASTTCTSIARRPRRPQPTRPTTTSSRCYKVLDAKLPYRVTDQAAPGGNEGDLVNFVHRRQREAGHRGLQVCGMGAARQDQSGCGGQRAHRDPEQAGLRHRPHEHALSCSAADRTTATPAPRP